MPTYDRSRFNPPAPVAMVGIHNPVTGETLRDVPMLIDTGADVTLVPKALAIRLKIPFVEEAEYELEGFGGSRSSARSAELQLHLGRFTFRGKFLLVAQDHGVLGRNLLNHMRFLLLGPDLE